MNIINNNLAMHKKILFVRNILFTTSSILCIYITIRYQCLSVIAEALVGSKTGFFIEDKLILTLSLGIINVFLVTNKSYYHLFFITNSIFPLICILIFLPGLSRSAENIYFVAKIIVYMLVPIIPLFLYFNWDIESKSASTELDNKITDVGSRNLDQGIEELIPRGSSDKKDN